ncbi:MAG: M48 family metallopeptidase, partial [Patescibacteria group bacterium]|nr:M48 family metallopeptidase [Patescibacteria group bacterium]
MIKIFFRRTSRRRRKPINKTHYINNKEKAREVINSRLKYFSDIYKVTYGRVSIRNQRTRWGSCSGQGNLNFNYRLFSLDSKIRDYVIVHEICHLKEFNHGKRFWQEVSKTIPDLFILDITCIFLF